MAKYRVLEKSFIDNKIVEEGSEIEYDGFPSKNLEPLDKAAKQLSAQAPGDAVDAARLHKAADGIPLDSIVPSGA